MSLPDDPVVTTTGDLDALRRRMSTDDRFRYRRHDLFTTVFTTPLTVDMVLGEQADTLRSIVNAVRDLHGHDVEIVFDTDGAEVAFCILKWRGEAHLRSLDSQLASVL
jgi:hypothetical protein